MKFILLPYFFLFTGMVACQGQTGVKPGGAKDSGYVKGPASAGGTGKFYLGREIAKVMGASGSAWLDRESRPDEENTQLSIDKINVGDSGVIADIGAGTGYYTFQLSPKVPQGKVYAVEIQNELIDELKKRSRQKGATNVEVIKGSEFSPNLPENSVDLAIMVDVYHELEYPREMLQAIKKSLRKKGRLLLIEYRGEDDAVRIKRLHKTTVAQLTKELAANGFTLAYRGDFLRIQHFLLFEKAE
ncbi:class I SAM-dependent methyltransferase [Foetidibacter luteolus]|uniref:class I SAM-dependent methyltransferase n=1 Tax=Foetidibacter luteolus TaxID=2608880 RepID=UPI00129AD2C8|nr:class I SAM-dependent methyltransferase [Foetidibacter luteolus]